MGGLPPFIYVTLFKINKWINLLFKSSFPITLFSLWTVSSHNSRNTWSTYQNYAICFLKTPGFCSPGELILRWLSRFSHWRSHKPGTFQVAGKLGKLVTWLGGKTWNVLVRNMDIKQKIKQRALQPEPRRDGLKGLERPLSVYCCTTLGDLWAVRCFPQARSGYLGSKWIHNNEREGMW